MPFQYSPSNPERITFTRLKSGCSQALFIVVGGIFTIIGLGLIVFGEDMEMPFGLIRFIFPLFGMVAVYAGINLKKIQSKTIPDAVVFDNKNGRVEINQKMSDINTSYIYYDEIEDLIVKPKKH